MSSKRAAKDCAVLSIAGSDPSGGAGIQADLKTFAAHGCYGMSVITSLTAQNTLGVKNVHGIPPTFVAEQIRAVLEDVETHAIKTGMLYDANISSEIAKVLRHYKSLDKLPPVVCDPVCVSTSGHTLLKSDAVDTLFDGLFLLSTVITPNKSEAEFLLRSRDDPVTISSLDGMLDAAQRLSSWSKTSVLLKGGHFSSTLMDVQSWLEKHSDVQIVKQNLLEENMEILLVGQPGAQVQDVVIDLLIEKGSDKTIFIRPRLDSTSTHGTGCTLSSAIACGLAQGHSLKDAVTAASLYTHLGILAAQRIGNGYGPLNHLHSIGRTLIPRRTPVNPYPFTFSLIEITRDIWKKYVEHDFVKQLAKGVLPRSAFVHFIKQDYHYLKYYARAYGLLAAKSSSFSAIGSAAEVIMNVIHEIATHRTFCASFGITEEELETTHEATATTAYGAYILNIGIQGDEAKLMMALMACLLGYGEVGLWLKKQSLLPNTWVVKEGNPYAKWMEDYSGEHYQGAVKIGLQTIETLVEKDPPSPSRLKEWEEVWRRCTELEKGFWDMAMEAAV